MPHLRLLFAVVLCCVAAAVKGACPAGTTGENCESPICTQTVKLDQHDGQEDYGDTIDSMFSWNCTDTYFFSVDEFVNTIYISVTGAYGTQKVAGTLSDPKGTTIPYTRVESFESYQIRQTYENLAGLYGRGKYSFKLTTYDVRGCMYVVQAPTRLVVDGGFITDKNSDAVEDRVPEQHRGVHKAPVYNVSSYFAFGMPTFIPYPARPLKVGIYSNGVPELDYPVTVRYKCGASAFAGPMKCDDVSKSYSLKVMGVDTQGNDWQRVYDFNCDATAPTATPTAPPPDACLNGGIMVNDGTPNRECWCPMYFEGRECEIKRCMNDGKLGDDERCNCKKGFTGTYCQHVQCTAPSETEFDISSRALVFVVRATTSMNVNRPQIKRAAERVGGFHGTHTPGYFMKYVLITIANGDLLSRDEYDQHQDFLNAIDNYPIVDDTSCDDSLFLGVSAALDSDALARYPYSPIFVFSDGLTNDNDDSQITVFQQLSFLKGQIFFMLTGSNGKCPPIDNGDPGYQYLRFLAQFSHGLVTITNTSDLNDATFNLAFALVQGSMIMSNDYIHSCADAPEYQSFFIDDKTDYYFIIATGRDLTVSGFEPDKKDLNPEILYSAGNSYIWYSKTAPLYGTYLLSLKSGSNGPCQYRVIGRTSSNLFVAMSNALTTDVSMQQPIWRQDSHLVARITNVDLSMNTQELHAEAVIWANDRFTYKRQSLYASNGIFRDQCGYNLYFGTWQCPEAFQVFSMNIYITDVNGYTMMRTATGFCSTEIPTLKPPTDCLNGGYPGGNGTCMCTPLYDGDKCQNILCLNGGTVLGTQCGCVTGFSGLHCEISTCYETNPNPWSPHNRSLTFVIHDSVTTRTALRSITQNIARVLENALSHHDQWISAYQVIRFNSENYTMQSNIRTTDGVVRALQDIYDRNRQLSEVSCADLVVIPALLDALQQPEFTQQGFIFLFLNGYIKDNVVGTVQLYEELENTKAQLNAVLLTSSPCGQGLDGHATQNLMNFAAFSGGRFFLAMPSRAGEVLRMVPTLYRSSFVYENYIEKCTVPQSIYFPVDSQTQAFTSYIVGDFATDPVYYYTNQDSNYKPDMPFYLKKQPVNILNDYGTGTRLDQLIRECDDDWYRFDSHCWWFGLQYKTWREAQTECHGMDAVMATIYNAAEQAFIETQVNQVNYWTGLNNIKNLAVWEWDQFGNNTLTLSSTGYTNWAGGQAPAGDEAKRCVYDNRKDTVKNWKPTDCSTRMSYICMKHVYDSEFEPEIDGSINDLPRGIWKINLQTQDGPCYVQIYAQSGIELYNEFTDNVHSDFGYPEPFASSEKNRYISHATNQQPIGSGRAGRLDYAHMYFEKNMSLVHGEMFKKRDTGSCSFEWISDTFKCPAPTYVSMSTGIDRFGFLYQRIQPILCMAGPTRPEDCKNGAVFNQIVGRCVCEPGFQGLYCEQPICMNGNLLPSKTKCDCYYGYMGALCDIPVCTRETNRLIPSPLNKTFVLAIDGTHSNAGMNAVLTGINDILTTVISKAAENAGWITHFTGIVFRDSGAQGVANISEVFESDSMADFVGKIQTEVAKMPSVAPTTESRPVMHALGYLLQSAAIQQRSELFIVTAGDIEDYEQIMKILTLIARKRVYANVLIVGDQTGPGGKLYNDSGVTTYFDLVDASGGNFYQVPPTAEGLKLFWTDLISSMFDTYYITKIWRQDCSNLVEYIQLGSAATSLIIDAVTLTKPTISIWNSDNDPMTGYTINRDTNTNHLISMSAQNKPGLWKVVVDKDMPTPGFCGISVRAQSTLIVNIGFIQDTGLDGGAHSRAVNPYPEAGDVQNAVAVASTGGTMLFAQIFARDDRTLLWSSPLISRAKCAYPYISANLFNCTEASFIVSIEGLDDEYHPIRRQMQVHCI